MQTFKDRFGLSKRALASIYRKAANLIKVHGYRKGEFGRKGYGFCAVGAVMSVIPGSYSPLSPLKALGISGSTATVMAWNDAPERTKDEVIRAFRRAARLLEHGAVIA